MIDFGFFEIIVHSKFSLIKIYATVFLSCENFQV